MEPLIIFGFFSVLKVGESLTPPGQAINPLPISLFYISSPIQALMNH
mgnify:CR=1 FL=1